ncbi:MAG: hypothetical protein QM692_04395 [Thermomicrobiales bacterium]
MIARSLGALAALMLFGAMFASPGVTIAESADGSASYSSVPTGAREQGVVVGLLDGNIIQVTIDGVPDAVALAGSNAPAPLLVDGTPACGGQEAANRLAALLPIGSTIALEALDGADARNERSALVRHVWLTSADGSDAVFIDKQMLIDGMAIWSDGAGSDHADELEGAAEDAEKRGVGSWRTCPDFGTVEAAQEAAVPTPSAADIAASYPVLPDVRELAIRPGSMLGDRVAFSGTVKTIGVASPGMAFFLGDDGDHPFESQLQVAVLAPDGTSEFVFIGYDGDTAGIYEGSWVTVYGTVIGTQTFENMMGGGVTQPLVDAELINLG